MAVLAAKPAALLVFLEDGQEGRAVFQESLGFEGAHEVAFDPDVVDAPPGADLQDRCAGAAGGAARKAVEEDVRAGKIAAEADGDVIRDRDIRPVVRRLARGEELRGRAVDEALDHLVVERVGADGEHFGRDAVGLGGEGVGNDRLAQRKLYGGDGHRHLRELALAGSGRADGVDGRLVDGRGEEQLSFAREREVDGGGGGERLAVRPSVLRGAHPVVGLDDGEALSGEPGAEARPDVGEGFRELVAGMVLHDEDRAHGARGREGGRKRQRDQREQGEEGMFHGGSFHGFRVFSQNGRKASRKSAAPWMGLMASRSTMSCPCIVRTFQSGLAAVIVMPCSSSHWKRYWSWRFARSRFSRRTCTRRKPSGVTTLASRCALKCDANSGLFEMIVPSSMRVPDVAAERHPPTMRARRGTSGRSLFIGSL